MELTEKEKDEICDKINGDCANCLIYPCEPIGKTEMEILSSIK
jgi:hypothetical protein